MYGFQTSDLSSQLSEISSRESLCLPCTTPQNTQDLTLFNVCVQEWRGWVCVSECVSMCVRVSVYAFERVYMSVCMRVCVCMHLCVCTWVSACLSECVRVWVWVSVRGVPDYVRSMCNTNPIFVLPTILQIIHSRSLIYSRFRIDVHGHKWKVMI